MRCGTDNIYVGYHIDIDMQEMDIQAIYNPKAGKYWFKDDGIRNKIERGNELNLMLRLKAKWFLSMEIGVYRGRICGHELINMGNNS